MATDEERREEYRYDRFLEEQEAREEYDWWQDYYGAAEKEWRQ